MRSLQARRRMFLIALMALPMALATAGCSGSSDNVPAPEAVVAVETARATIQPIVSVVTAEGVLYPRRQASISPKITAPVRKFYAERGENVHAGELLAVLENHDLAAAVVSAQGGYDQAKATYASTTSSALPEEIQTAQWTLNDTQTNLKAQEQLYTSEQKLYREGAIARKQLDATQVALTAARGAFETAQKHLSNLQASGLSQKKQAAKGQLEVARGQYEAATAQLAYTQIRSPINGVLASRAVFPGDIAPAGTPLLIVMDTSEVVARLHVPESQAAQLKIGDWAQLQVSGFQKTFPARVTVVSPALDPNSTTVEIWVQADNSKGELKPGTSVQVSITTRTVPSALVIPDHAILTRSKGVTSVMVVSSDGRAYSRPVKTGVQNGSMIQIVSGLKAGDNVIASGAYGLPDKTKVTATVASPQSSSKVQGP